MGVSLSAKAERIGQQRRKIADLQSKREELLSALDKFEENMEQLVSKLNDWKEGDAIPQADLASQVNSARDEYAKQRKAVISLSDTVRSEQSVLAELEADYRMREEHNQTEQTLNSSAGRGIVGSGVVGNDGAKLQQAGGISDPVKRVVVLAPDMKTQQHDLGVLLQCELIRQIDHLSPQQAIDLAANHFGNERVSSAMQANIHTAGGSLIAGAFSTAWIELLRAKAIVRASGVPSVPISDGTLTIGRKTGASTSYYRGEGENSTPSQLTTGDMKLVAKEMVTQVAITEKLARSPSAGATAMVRDDIVESAALCEDLHFIRGVAAGAGPTGMRYLAASANVLTMTATPDLAKVTTDLGRMELVLMSNNVDVMGAVWGMSPRTFVYLMNLRDGNGNLAFPELTANGTLRKKAVYVTTQIPENLSTNQSELYLYSPRACLIGDGLDMTIVASNVAAYDVSGTLTSAFSKGEIVTRLTMENDFNLRQLNGVAVMTGLTWGV